MTHQEVMRMLARNDDEAMGEDEARAVMAVAEAAGLAVDPTWVEGPGPMIGDAEVVSPILLMVGL